MPNEGTKYNNFQTELRQSNSELEVQVGYFKQVNFCFILPNFVV